jgi:hypothetical protein
MRRVFAAVALLVGVPGEAARARNGVRTGAVTCLSLDADDPGDDPEEAPGPHGTLPDDEERFPIPSPPSTEPSSPEDELPSEPAAAHDPPARPMPLPSPL